ncbi:hypothetical protein GCM10009823_15830 [Brevibacterium salitolerans]|uniref:NYN domain-containing protein n=2 Tax=Brevibacteriaceae TaxID=85019 RepID=A0ABP5I931_9MICO
MPGMQEQSAVFIDAGFLLAVGSTKTTGTSLRSSTVVDVRRLIAGIVERTKEDAGLSPLRVYWYDASHHGVMADEHKKIALIDDVKVRLGRIGINGAQKGVDLRLGLDMVEVARNRSARVAYLLCGDDDIAEAVEAAQDQGMKVVLVGLEDPGRRVGLSSVAEHLALQVDRIITIPSELIRSCFEPSMSHRSKESAEGITTVAAASVTRNTEGAEPGHTHAAEGKDAEAPSRPVPKPGPPPRPAPPASVSSPGTARPHVTRSATTPLYSTSTESQDVDCETLFDVVEEVAVNTAESWLNSATQIQLEELLRDYPYLEPDIDRALLQDCAAQIGETETNSQAIRKHLRDSFWAAVRER